MDSPIQEVKERLDIVEVVSSYLKLEKTGANFRALCPFHSEKKPSFFVSPSRQLWRCFGCGAGGDVFAFVQQIEGVEFGDALRMLARKAGVELKRQDPQLQTARKNLYNLCELATRFFEKQLQDSQSGQKVKEYLLNRGITKESIEQWRIGFAPDSWDGLMNFLKQKNFSVGDMKRAGVVLESEQGKVYDRFRGRIIFPIFDLNSQVVGFGGRIFGEKKEEETTAKYLNIPNTLLYNKSWILYGLNRAKIPIRKNGECVLVEGYTDVIISHQAGMENVVATSGTALTPFQLSILKRYTHNLTTAFDMDIAGDSATKRGIDLAQAQGFDIKVATLPEGTDPADVASKTPEDWKKILKEAKSILEFYFQSAFLKFDSQTPSGKREISKMLVPVIKRVQNTIEQSHWIRELAGKLNVSEESVQKEVQKYLPGETAFAGEEITIPILAKSRRERIEEKIISLLLNYPEGLDLIKEDCLERFSLHIRKILEQFKKSPKDFSKNLEQFDFSKDVKQFLDFLALAGEIGLAEAGEEVNLNDELSVCLRELLALSIKEKMAEISEKIKQAEQTKNSQDIEKLSQEFNQLAKQLP